jgi:GntP family gluconate:H+ symporter
VAAGAAATHALVPPTPGPLAVSGILGVDLGVMIAVGLLVALPAASAGLWYAGWIDRRMPVPLRADPRAPVTDGDLAGPSGPHPPRDLPGLMASASPIVLPVLLISANTIVGSVTPEAGRSPFWRQLAAITATLGNANLALLLAAGIAVWVFARHRRPERGDVASLVETSLMSGGVIILITAAGGAFGAMLQAAQVGPEIQAVFAGGRGAGFAFLGLGFVVASLIKVAQGSSTVAMITAAGMLAAMVTGADALPFHTVYLAIAITAGSLVGTWMNDSGFWVFSKMGGVTEMETLRSWTVVSATVGVTALVVTAILAMVMPLR